MSGPTEFVDAPRAERRVRAFILGGVALVIVVMLALYLRSLFGANRHALAQSPKPVTVERAQAGSFRPSRSYVGTLEPWSLARVGPQYVSAYVGAVLVRPGAAVRRGEVLATLDCRSSSAASREIAERARALEERRNALAHETDRMKQLIDGGFASANEVEQLSARTSAEAAELESLHASMTKRGLEVDDCVLRAPFTGEIADRFVDPGAYARPGQPLVTMIDRATVRVTAEAPESDFDVVAPGVPVQIVASRTVSARISRRAPAADDVTRTVHFEIDVPNADRALPVGTTAVVHIEVGEPRPAVVLPLRAATVRGERATLFTVEGDRARRTIVPVLGEVGGALYLDPKLAAGTEVVVEGRALLDDGDRVRAGEAEK
jgi:RND family efflux transporter MFP subunit